MKATKKIARILKNAAKYFALAACGSAAFWGGYQAKEPANLKKLCK